MTEQQLNALDWPGWTILDHIKFSTHVKLIRRVTEMGCPIHVSRDYQGCFWVNAVPFALAQDAFEYAEESAKPYGGWE